MKTLLLLPLALLIASCSNVPTCKEATAGQPACHNNKTKRWTAPDGTSLPCIGEMPSPAIKTKAVVILVAGQDGTLCDYQSLTRALVQHGYAVYGVETRTMAYDSNVSRRGSSVPWQQWVKDLQGFTAHVKNRHPRLPIYYHSHSFGSVVAMESIAQCASDATKRSLQPRGLILHSPAFAMLPKNHFALVDAILWPFSGLRVNHLNLMENRCMDMTADQRWNCAWLKSDNRVKAGYKLAWFLQALKMGAKAREASRHLTIPTLALEGEKDTVTLGGRADYFMAKSQADYERYLNEELPRGNTQVIPYPEGRHLLTEGPGKQKPIRDIIAWLDSQP